MGVLEEDPPTTPTLRIWKMAVSVLQSLTHQKEPSGGKPSMDMDTPVVLDGGDGSSMVNSEATETLTVYALMIDLEVLTTDEWGHGSHN